MSTAAAIRDDRDHLARSRTPRLADIGGSTMLPPRAPRPANDRVHALYRASPVRSGRDAHARRRRSRRGRPDPRGVLRAAAAAAARPRAPRGAALALPDGAARREQPSPRASSAGAASCAGVGAPRGTVPRDQPAPRRGASAARSRGGGPARRGPSAPSAVGGRGPARSRGGTAAGDQSQHRVRPRASAATAARSGALGAGDRARLDRRSLGLRGLVGLELVVDVGDGHARLCGREGVR